MIKYLRAVWRLVIPVLDIVVVVDESLLWYVFAPGGHVVGYLPNSGSESLQMSNFPQSFDNKSIDFCWDARTVRHRQYSEAPRYDPRHIGCYPIRLGIESGAWLWDWKMN